MGSQTPATPDRMLKINEVVEVVGLHRATIYRMIHAGEFPTGVPLRRSQDGSCRRRGWAASDVTKWLTSQACAPPS